MNENKKMSPIVKCGLIFLSLFFILGLFLKIKEEGFAQINEELGLAVMMFSPVFFILLATVLIKSRGKKDINTENSRNVYRKKTFVMLILSIYATFLFVDWFRQPNSNEAVWIYGLFLLIPIIVLWTVCLNYFNKYRKERNLNQTQ